MLSPLDREGSQTEVQRSQGSCLRPHSSPRATAQALSPYRDALGSAVSFLHVQCNSRKEAPKKVAAGGGVTFSGRPGGWAVGPGAPSGPFRLLVLITWKAQGH